MKAQNCAERGETLCFHAQEGIVSIGQGSEPGSLAICTPPILNSLEIELFIICLDIYREYMPNPDSIDGS